jgi:hypothetical protein
MIPPVEHRPGPLEYAIHHSREPRTQRLHAAPERDLRVRFDEEVSVVAL